MTFLLESALLLPVEALLNKVLARDAYSRQRLTVLGGRVIEIEFRLPALLVSVRFLERSIQLSSIGTENPDARLVGTARQFFTLLANGATSGSIPSGVIEIHGDAELVQEVYRIFSALDVDWQGSMSAVFGDVVTHGVEEVSTTVTNWSSQASRQVVTNLDEYLHEESRWLPSRLEAESFNQRLDDMRLRLDRLTATLAQLRKRMADA